MEVETEVTVDEPFEEYVKQDNISAEDKNETNVDVIGYKLFK